MRKHPPEVKQFTVKRGEGARLDLWLSGRLELSRSQIKRLIDRGLVAVNGSKVKAGYRIGLADQISVSLPGEKEPALRPEPLPLEIIYEDEELAVVVKPKGLVVHPGPGNWEGTLVNALLFHLDKLSAAGEVFRPGIVHRLDKDTAGLLAVAKTDQTYFYLKHLFQRRLVERGYLGLVQGAVSEEQGMIDFPLGRHPKDRKKMAVLKGGREAQTRFQVVERFQRHSLLCLSLITGRTHQIRVHLAGIHHPLVGDPLYGFRQRNLGAKSQVLLAKYLAFPHPRGEFLEFELQPEGEFLEFVEKARGMN